MKKFDIFWNDLLIELRTPKKIKNWTVKKGQFGEDFTAHVTTNNVILCTTLKGSENKSFTLSNLIRDAEELWKKRVKNLHNINFKSN